jgi:L-galactose dehydrogenase
MRTLGRDRLPISSVGFGLGGKSRAGANQGLSLSQQAKLLRLARDLGINYFDTAESYGNESLLTAAFSPGERNSLIISSKFSIPPTGPIQVQHSLEKSLQNLGRDCIDIYLVHALAPNDYQRVLNEALPDLLRLKQEGKIRCIGISERFEVDPSHTMVRKALQDHGWDIFMVGHSVINPSAGLHILPQAQAQGLDMLGMFAVRNVMSQPDRFRELIRQLVQEGHVAAHGSTSSEPLHDLMRDHGIHSLTELGYRFTAHAPGLSSMLLGTGNSKHLKENIRAVTKGPLPQEILTALFSCFGHLDHLSGS